MTDTEKKIAYLRNYISPSRYERIVEVSKNRTNHLAVVVENLYQSHNMSAVLRTAECLGIQNVHIIENKFKYHLSKEVSMGADKWLNLHRYNPKENNTEDCIKKVKALGYKVVATMPAEKDFMLDDVDISVPTAFLFGTELLGLTRQAIALADEFVKIPMYGFTESYNISVSMALTMMNVTERMRHSDINWRLSENELSALQLEWIKMSLKDPDGILSRYEQDQ
ncbi:MAG: RNA methyltransferase [Bacteroidales bacterium]|nr:RNA methyltransferase [Bacteroidales bacterium]